MATVSVRDIVNDVDAAIAFYCRHLEPLLARGP
jgi:catechol 2,3-dioxygenase-like lactoylglutathione lyase family enzyme